MQVQLDKGWMDAEHRWMRSHGCSSGTAPRLHITRAPAGTRAFAVTMVDTTTRPPFVHWVAWNLPDAVQTGRNTRGNNEFMAPCPPVGGGEHTYLVTVYALREPLTTLRPGATMSELLAALPASTVRATLSMTYSQ